MKHVIRISKRGFNVLDIDGKPKEGTSDKAILPHMLQILAWPYILGAKKQVRRYSLAIALNKNAVEVTNECLHEISTLFEDLCTIGKYAEKCGQKHKMHQLFLDVRNHIRHDFREEFDVDTKSYKNARRERLKLDPRLQTDISFEVNSIKVGGIRIEIDEINTYLAWVEQIMTTIMNKAKEKSYVE